jgi:N-acetyl-anhydromuramyl-L-alanine amidase AmpD
MKFVEAKHWKRGVPPRTVVKWIVLHATDTSEIPDRAEKCARYFAELIADDKLASAHYAVDCDTEVQCVREDAVAYHAKGANKFGIGIEHAGLARQTRAEWLDPYGQKMLSRSAEIAAGAVVRWGIPVQFVDRAGLLRGKRGFTTHHECVLAFGGSHHDPGPGFPMDFYLDLVRDSLNDTKPAFDARRIAARDLLSRTDLTKADVRVRQRAIDVEDDGVVGPKTLARAKEIFYASHR